MNVGSIKDDFRKTVCEQIELQPQGEGRFLVKNPFRFEDGDHFVITLKREGNGWILTDEANTIMHLSYWMAPDALEEEGNRKEIIDSSLSLFSVENRDGELVKPVKNDRFGDALFNFVQALTKVSDVSFLTRERVRSTFMEDLMKFLREKVDNTRLSFNWKDQDRDPTGKYMVDCRINTMRRPLFVYGIQSDAKAHVATISLLRFESWNLPFRSLGVFEDQEDMDPKPVARFTDAVEKTFSSLEGNKENILKYINKTLREDQEAKRLT